MLIEVIVKVPLNAVFLAKLRGSFLEWEEANLIGLDEVACILHVVLRLKFCKLKLLKRNKNYAFL